MPKRTPELLNFRRNEIIDACERLYETKGFKEITMADIAEETTFTRTSIYNYFRTKEEIFLALYTREYDRWNRDLREILRGEKLPGGIPEAVARSLEKREQLLKLLSMNNYDMEANSRPELLVEFKASYGRSRELIRQILRKFRPDLGEAEIREVIALFFPFMFGIYPYVSVTDKQKAAMEAAGVVLEEQTVYTLTRSCLAGLLGEGKGEGI